MNFSAIISAADADAANNTLEAAGFGEGNFSVPLSATGSQPPTHYGLNSQGDLPEFLAAVTAIPDVSLKISDHVAFTEHAADLELQTVVNLDEPL